MKLIKFDLPIDGTKVRNIEELRDHFNTEILDLHKSGLLAKWLRSQRQPDLLAQVEAIAENSSDQARLDALCRVFSIELDSEIIQQLTQLHDQGIKRGGIRIDPLQIEYESFHEKYLNFIKKYKAFSTFCNTFNSSTDDYHVGLEYLKFINFMNNEDRNICWTIIKVYVDRDYCHTTSARIDQKEIYSENGILLKTELSAYQIYRSRDIGFVLGKVYKISKFWNEDKYDKAFVYYFPSSEQENVKD